ncbi:hypothetical protein [Candidatus Marinarcus aquaticus]|uniref:Uncharacterized protein n=1 Tax=Candidatus Marinarcus aquaticus TaxID=2044504 RepID=A0A4Q0XRB2_9BACT|nr:hypothetical protein [Candidatus Marinarcus aquaticus]RXJ57597.1 hypothetical protein CRV04_07230 [Candidatus Marinarcus aquaticus]
MDAPLIIRPEIALENFFPIFLSSAFVIILGLFYIGIFTLVKINKLKSGFMPVAYVFWLAQTFCLYYLGILIRSEAFTQYVLMAAMFGFLVIPHFIYFLLEKTHENVEH